MMVVGSSLTDQIGIATEAGGWGVYTAPTDFLLLAARPDFAPTENYIETLPYGRLVMGVDDARHYEFGGAGTITVDARTKGLDILLEHIFGPSAGGGVFVPIANPGISATVQVGRTEVGGTVRPFNYLGCVATALELTIGTDANPRIVVTYDVGTHETTTALAVASYPAGNAPFSWLDGAITKDSAEACFRSLTIRVERATNTNRRCIGGSKKQQIGNGEIMVTGSAEVEFESMADYDKFRTGGTAALDVALSHNGASLAVAIPVLRYRTFGFGGDIADINTAMLDFKGYKGVGAITTWTYAEGA